MPHPILPAEWNILPFEYPFSFLYGKSFLGRGGADGVVAGLSRSRKRDGGSGRLWGGRAQQAAALAGGRRQCPLVFVERGRGRGGAAGQHAHGPARSVIRRPAAGRLLRIRRGRVRGWARARRRGGGTRPRAPNSRGTRRS